MINRMRMAMNVNRNTNPTSSLSSTSTSIRLGYVKMIIEVMRNSKEVMK